MLYNSGHRPSTLLCFLKLRKSLSFPHPSIILEVWKWLLSKGASSLDTWPNSRANAALLLGSTLGTALTRNGPRDFRPSLVSRSVEILDSLDISHICNKDFFDDCQCCCSSSGCGFVNVLHTAMNYGRPYGCRQDVWFTWCLSTITHYAARVREATGSKWISQELMRLLIFVILELRHTCCDTSRIYQKRIQIRRHFITYTLLHTKGDSENKRRGCRATTADRRTDINILFSIRNPIAIYLSFLKISCCQRWVGC